MAFNQNERASIVSRYAALYRATLFGDADEAAAGELAALGREYESGLPQIPFARCPIGGEVQLHSFDPFGLDGPWWNYDAPLRPLMERIPSCLAVNGALALHGEVPNMPWLVRPGPGLPFVLPKLLAVDGIFATIRQLAVGPHTAWTVCYFGAEEPEGLALPNAWGTGAYWDASDGMPGWNSRPSDPFEWDFSLSPWIARGKLYWIAPGDDTLTLRAEIAGCPFVGLPGEKREQRIAFGRVMLDNVTPPDAVRLTGSETIGDFEMFELEEGLREELRLPPVPVPVRQRSHAAVFPSGGPVNLLAMLEEAQAFVAANPQVYVAYRPLQAALSSYAGMAATERGAHVEALQCYQAGLQAAPENMALRSHEALALQALGRHAEAREKLEAIVNSVPRGEIMPLVWMLLARRYVEDGEPDKARPLLEELSTFGGEDAAVARFAATMSGSGAPHAMVAEPAASVSPAAAEPAGPRMSKGLVLGLLLALAAGLGGFAAWRVLGPAGAADEAPGAQGPPSISAAGGTDPAVAVAEPSSSAAPASDAASSAIARDLPGIWAPEDGGCAGGFGFAFTPAGRFAEGDEYSGEEGRWSVADGRLTVTIALKYHAEDEVSERKVSAFSNRYAYRIKSFTPGRMELANGEAELAFVRCPDGRRLFVDGEAFP